MLCALAILLVRDHARGDSITIDEPLHMYAAAEYSAHGVMFTNPEHPPLAKNLAALSLMRSDVAPPAIVPGAPLPPLRELVAFLRGNRVPYREMIGRARLPFRFLLAALIVVVYMAARIAQGTPAAMLASALIAFDPNFLAHAGIVHTDVAAALLMTLTVVLTVWAIGKSWIRWMLAGIALGLAIAVKFSALILVPLVLLAPLLGDRIYRALAACGIAALFVFTVYTVNLRHMHPDDAALASATFLQSRQADPATVDRYASLTRRLPPLGMFATGVKGVQLASANGRGWNYLHGQFSSEGFPHYFFVAFLMKSTPAMLLVTLAIAAGGRRLRNRWSIAALAVVGVIFAVSIPSSFNIGVRHILPVYPLLAITGAGVLASLLPRRAFAIVAVVLIAGAAASVASIHPYELGYFNFMGGPEWLSDSNVDWGQDVDRMHAFLRERGWERDTSVSVLSIPGLHDVERYPDGGTPTRRYATSVMMEHFDPSLARRRVIARIGASITIRER